MKLYKKISLTINKNRIFFLAYVPLAALFFLWGFMLINNPSAAATGVSEGIELCLGTVIPSLFPFMFFSSVLSESGCLNRISAFTERLSRALFALPGVSAPIILMSMIGGYPVGALMIKNAFEKGELSYDHGRRMLLFCVNPGPAFTVSTVGSMLAGSEKVGFIIYISTITASLAVGVLTRFIAEKDDMFKPKTAKAPENNIFNGISESASHCVGAILNICTWIVVFSCLNELVENLPLSRSSVMIFKVFSEVTGGVIAALEHYPLYVTCGIISFAGACIHLQLMPAIISLKLRYKYFLTGRIVSAALSTIIAYFLFRAFPVSISTASVGIKPSGLSLSSSIPVCISMLFMCGFFIIGDNYFFSRKKNRETNI